MMKELKNFDLLSIVISKSLAKSYGKIVPLIVLLVTLVGLCVVIINSQKKPTEASPDRKYFQDIYPDTGFTEGRISTGASWTDFDNDGHLDLLITGLPARLYKNNGDETFTDITGKSGLSGIFAAAGVFADYDNDGCPDLFLNTMSRSPLDTDRLFHGNCDGTFTDVTIKSGVIGLPGGASYAGAAWADYDNDGFLDLYLANYGTFPSPGIIRYEQNILYRNNGDGTFTNVTDKAGVSGLTNCVEPRTSVAHIKESLDGPLKASYQPIWFDANADGHIDLFIATDHGISPLYLNNGDGTFKEVTKENGLCRYGSGMGVVAEDFDNDGDLDIYVTNVGSNYFWKNDGKGFFREAAKDLEISDSLSIGWGTGALDFNNDGNLDLFVTNGIVINTEHLKGSPVGEVRLDKLYQNLGHGKFVEIAEILGIKDDHPKEGLAFADYNNDGFTDLVVTSGYRVKQEANHFYRNSGNDNNWLTVKLIGTKSNLDSIGANITVKAAGKTQFKQLQSGGSFLSQNSPWPTFGLGKAVQVDEVKVKWPSGAIKILHNVKTNQLLTITEPL